MDLTLTLTSAEHKDLTSYCTLNKFNTDEIVKKSYLEGLRIEKYGLLSGSAGVVEKEVVKEVIKYVEVPVVEEKEVIRIEYVEIPSSPSEVEVIKYVDREVIKEVFIEVPVSNIDNISDKNREEELLSKIGELETENKIFSTKLDECGEEIKIFSTKMVEMENIFQNKTSDSTLKPKLDALQKTVQKLREEIIGKDRLVKEYEKTIEDIQKFQENKQAVYLKGSNLDDKLYK
jgi:hypothetical protein